MIWGGDGNDTVYAGTGNDTIYGGRGVDSLFGEAGSDSFIVYMGGGNDTVNGGAAGGWTDTIKLYDSAGLGAIGNYGVDWTLSLTSGSITSMAGDQLDLSTDADGTITMSDGTTITFTDVERIQWS